MLNSVNYPQYYPHVMVDEVRPNPQVKLTVQKVNEEIKIKQAYVKVEFLENTLKNKELSKPERFTLEYMLQDAKREFAQLKGLL